MNKWSFAILLVFTGFVQAGPVAFIADLNGRYGSIEYHPRVAEAVASIIALEPEAVVIAGDMIAGQVSPPLDDDRLRAMWESFNRVIHEPLRKAGIKVLAVPGNHDASIYPAYEHERAAYERYWMPHRPDGLAEQSKFPWYYAVELTARLVVGLDVTSTGAISAAQESFLEEQRRVAASAQKALIVVTHLPLYPVAVGREKETFTSNIAPMPGETWISGHHHAFYAGVTPAGGVQLSLPPLGGNRRAWLGTSQRGPFGFARFQSDDQIIFHAWPGFTGKQSGLGPESIEPLRRQKSLDP